MKVDVFEQEFAEYVGIEHCLAFSSGTSAMPRLNGTDRFNRTGGVKISRGKGVRG
jgi:cystathionine beta-lyase/cystathionine gamma-synthase